MNVLSKLLDVAAIYGVINFHPKCKKINLIHLCFVDDMLIFPKENWILLYAFHDVMKLFYSYSRLQLNSAKSELFSTRIRGRC